MNKRCRLDRSDGYFEKNQSALSLLFNNINKRRCDNLVFFKETINVTNILEYIKKNDKKITMLHLLVSALIKTAKEHPKLNRFVINGRIYTHKDLIVATTIKRELKEESDELIGKFKFDITDNINDVSKKLTKEIKETKEKNDSDDFLRALTKLPNWIVKLLVKFMRFLNKIDKYPKKFKEIDPLFSSAFVANLGSIKLDAPYHHLYEWGTCSLFVAMGVIQKRAIIIDDKIVIKDVCDITFTIDERIGEGMVFGSALKTFKDYIENPEKLEE